MNKDETSVEMFRNGCACSQAILANYSDKYGLDTQLAMHLSAGFGAGMGVGETCGAATGSFMVLGLHGCGADCENGGDREQVSTLVEHFTTQFKSINGALKCKELLGFDISKEDELEEARNQGLFDTVCVRAVDSSTEILDELLK